VNLDILVNGILCIIAVIVALYHSREAYLSSIALFLGFLFYITAWAPDGWNPRDIVFTLTGEKIKSAWFWIFGDYLVLMGIGALAIDTWWGCVLVLTFLSQISLHIFKIYDMIDSWYYLFSLDQLFHIQIMTFLVIGIPPTYRLLKQKITMIYRCFV
jgi:hypothetical protein